MPILDLRDAKPLFPKPAPVKQARRTLSPASVPGLALGNGHGGFQGAEINRLSMDFVARSTSVDQTLYGDNKRLRARANDLCRNNPFAKKFLAMCSQNIVGTEGIQLQAKVRNAYGKSTADTDRINQRIEEEWKRWCRRGRPTVDGRMSFLDVQRLAIKNCAREGENLLKSVYGLQYNSTGFALQPLDNDQLDDTMMLSGGNGTEIRMGVECDMYRRPLAYHLWQGHPNDILSGRNRERVRVPASDIIHTAIWERPGQTRGYTWMSAAILPLNQQGRYEEAVIVAARASAAKFFAIESEVADGMDFSQDDDDSEAGAPGAEGTGTPTHIPDPSVSVGANAGDGFALAPGENLNFIDPRFPTANHEQFMKTMLRSVATGLLTSYPSLANDLEGVNFSSIRAGLLDERDGWRVLQRWFIESFLEPVFSKWLSFALLTVLSDIVLTPLQMEQMTWRARGWPWVDPMKDAQSTILNLGNAMSTYSRELASQGLDFEEVMQERAAEQAYIKTLGLVLGTDISGDQSGKGQSATAGEEPEAAEAEGGGKPAAKGSK